MKDTPGKVFILKNGGYIEISYEEFCQLTEKNNSLYKDKFFLPLHGMLMEVTETVYKDFYKEKRRQKYLNERSEENGDFSYDMLTTREFCGEDILIDKSEDIAVWVEHHIELEKLQSSLFLLSKEEQSLVQEIFFEELTERNLAEKYHISQAAVHKRKVRV